MSVTARGPLASAAAKLREMLSNCASLQKLLQVANAAEALELVHIIGTSQNARPLVLVDYDEWMANDVAGGGKLTYVVTGGLALYTELSTRYEVEVTSEDDGQTFTCSALAGLKDDHFNGLQLKMTTGDQGTQYDTIADFNGLTGEITLETGLPGAPGVGSVARIEPASEQDLYIWTLNTWGDVITELLQQSGEGNMALRQPKFQGANLAQPNEGEETQHYVMAAWTFGFGR